MKPKEFIQKVLIDETHDVVLKHPYLVFALISIGIEFLGKCLDSSAVHWNVPGKSKYNFEYAINNLTAFSIYRPYLKRYKIWCSLRNGFTHSFVPKYSLTLSSKNEMSTLTIHSNNKRLNLRCEDFYNDFKKACIEIINMKLPNPNDKMNKQLLSVPELEID